MRFALVPNISTPRCPECKTYPISGGCECPAGYVDLLGYLRCVACANECPDPDTEPISRHGVEAADRCESCGFLVLSEPAVWGHAAPT